MSNLNTLTTRFARRPLLILPSAAENIVQHLAQGDPRGMHTESRLEAILRKVGLGRPQPAAMHDHDDDRVPEPTGPVCYAPLWAEQRYGDPTDTGFGWSLFNGVAMMEVDNALSDRGEYYCGTFYHGYNTILAAIREAQADERVKGIFIRMMCPGGVVAGGINELAAFMRANRASAGGKPIHIYADMAASAAYWIAAQADHISAPRVGLVGSIGAVLVHYDFSQAYAKMGVVVTPIQFGAEKTAGVDWAPLSASAKADLQAEIDQCGNDFVADVHAGRPQLTVEALLATQARVFMANNDDPERSGLALGFVDAIETEEQAFDRLLSVITTAQTSTSPQILKSTGASAQSPKETTPMATAPKANAKPAQRKAEAAAETETAVDATAQTDAEDCPDCDGTGVDGDDACDTCGGTGTTSTADPEAKAEDATPDTAAEAKTISNSPEALANPSLALAAINNGLTYAQFKGMASTPAGKGAPSALRAAMSHTKAMGADAPNAATPSLGQQLVANARARNPKA